MTETPDIQAPKFTAGTVVRLNSGGPKMTALSDQKKGKVSCQWFDRNGKMHKSDFEASALEKFTPKPFSQRTEQKKPTSGRPFRG